MYLCRQIIYYTIFESHIMCIYIYYIQITREGVQRERERERGREGERECVINMIFERITGILEIPPAKPMR